MFNSSTTKVTFLFSGVTIDTSYWRHVCIGASNKLNKKYPKYNTLWASININCVNCEILHLSLRAQQNGNLEYNPFNLLTVSEA